MLRGLGMDIEGRPGGPAAHLAVVDLDGEGAAGDAEDGHSAEERGELLGVERGGRDDHLRTGGGACLDVRGGRLPQACPQRT